MRLGIWELPVIAVIIVLLFNGKRLAHLEQAFEDRVPAGRRGAEGGAITATACCTRTLRSEVLI